MDFRFDVIRVTRHSHVVIRVTRHSRVVIRVTRHSRVVRGYTRGIIDTFPRVARGVHAVRVTRVGMLPV